MSNLPYEHVSDRQPPIIRKGEWFTYCCSLDMEEATEDIEWDGMIDYRVYPTKEALIAYEERPGSTVDINGNVI